VYWRRERCGAGAGNGIRARVEREPRLRMDEAAFRSGIRSRLTPAWERLESLYGDALRRQAALILPAWQDPENAVGEVWLKAISSAHRYEPAYPPYPWLAHICLNTCLNQRRGLRHVIVDALQRRRRSEEPASAAERTDARGTLRSALMSLPDREREVVTLRFLFEVPVSEITTLLGIETNTAHQALSRGLGRLRRVTGGQGFVAAADSERKARGEPR
jgi:RNA polymerase sigma factor (sigma-70 family)